MRALLLTLLLAAFPRLATAADKWLEVKSPHFTVIGNGRQKALEKVAADLELMRVVFQAGLPISVDPPVPVVVVAVKREKDLEALAPSKWKDGHGPAGFFRNAGTQIDIALRLDVSSATGTIAFHEYHHLIVDRAMPFLPLWLREGLAELWGGAKVSGRNIEVGRPETLGLEYMQHRSLIPLDELITAGHDSKYYKQKKHVGTFYTQSTVLTHMLLLKTKEGEAKLTRFIELIDSGVPQANALEQTFGKLEEIEGDLRRYTRDTRFTYVRKTMSKEFVPPTPTTRALTPAEVAANRGAFLARGGEKKAAEKMLLEALDLDPKNPQALVGLSLISGRDQALSLLDRATSAGDATFDAHWYSAVWMATTSSSSPSVERHLERAIELNPSFAAALVRLAEVRATRDSDEAFSLLAQAVRLEPGRPAYLIRAAKIMRRRGVPSEATRLATDATKRAVLIPRSSVNNDICWNGTLAGFAQIVMPACERAVELAPENWNVRDSRALARAVTGDVEGAIADFNICLEKAAAAGRTDFVDSRTAWVLALRDKKNPFDESALARLDEVE